MVFECGNIPQFRTSMVYILSCLYITKPTVDITRLILKSYASLSFKQICF